MSESLDLLRRIDAACERFEAELQAGGAPLIESVLSTFVERERLPLFVELLGLEIDYVELSLLKKRRSDLIERFPEYRPEIESRTAATREGQATRAAHGAEPGRRLGNYELLHELGRGGMAIVYEARDRSLNRIVALKVLMRATAMRPGAVERFVREAKTMARFDHPNIVPVFDIGRSGDTSYFAMARVRGLSLGQLLEDLRSSECTHEMARALAALRQADATHYAQRVGAMVASAGEGLAHAHRAHIVHRDVKPSNILVESGSDPADTGQPTANVLLTDFGLARVDCSDLTLSTDVLGTLPYMAPERFEGVCTEQGDVYSLGLVLYELLALSRPFSNPDRASLVGDILAGRIEPLVSVWPAVPARLAEIVHRAVAESLVERYATAAELVADLREFSAGRASCEAVLGKRMRAPVGRVGQAVGAGAACLVAATTALLVLGDASPVTDDKIQDAPTPRRFAFTPPRVLSMRRLDPSPTTADTVRFAIEFDQVVRGFTAASLELSSSASIVRIDPRNSTSIVRFQEARDRVVQSPLAGFPQDAVTVEFWLRVDDDCPKLGHFFSFTNLDNSGNTFSIGAIESVRFAVADSFLDQTETGLDVRGGDWHHLALSWESLSGRAQLYADGQMVYSRTLKRGERIGPELGYLVLGDEQDSFGGEFELKQAFRGAMDDIRIWRGELLPEQLNQPLGSRSDEDLCLAWDFEGQPSTSQTPARRVVVDRSANGNDGLILHSAFGPLQDYASNWVVTISLVDVRAGEDVTLTVLGEAGVHGARMELRERFCGDGAYTVVGGAR